MASTTAPTLAGRREPKRVSERRRRLRPYLVSLPGLIITGGILVPFGLGLYYTLFNFAAVRPNPDFVGLDNFGAIVGSSEFWGSVGVTVEYAVLTTVIETLLGTGVALLLYRGTGLGRVLERVLIVPLMIAPVIAAILWNLMLQPSVGVVNHLLEPIGGGDIQWTNTPLGALGTSIAVDVWIFTPFVALLVLAGLRSLPREPFEAASVDGARWWFTFRKLTLPMLWPYILVAVIFRFMDSLKMFDIIYALTQGGPGNATEVLQVRAYQEAIGFTNFSFGITYMAILWAVVFAVTRLLVGALGRAQARAAGIGREAAQ